MRSRLKAVLLLTLCGASPAAAQMYPGQDVIVNPAAAGSGLLLYPGGKYGRVVHTLRQPGANNDPYGPIQLHMPRRHVARHAVHTPKVAANTPVNTPVQPPSHAPAPPPSYNNLPDDSASRLIVGGNTPHTPPKPPQKQTPQKQAPAQQHAANNDPITMFEQQVPQTPQTQIPQKQAPQTATPKHVASLGVVHTPPSGSGNSAAEGLSRRSAILFSPGAESPAPAALDQIKALANDLNAALSGGAARIQLQAYGGARGDKSSDARRLSLKRALVIRQVLIDDGVPSERIDVRAMGGADDNGAADRVDVFVRS